MKRFLLAGLVLVLVLTPTLSDADNDGVEYEEAETYEVKVITGEDSDGNPVSGTLEIEYEGMVPCGRCLPVKNSSSTGGYFSEELDIIHGCPSSANAPASNPPRTFIPCSLCHLFIVFDRIISFVLGLLIPAVALIVIVGSGVLMILSTGNPEKVTKAKDTLLYAVLGLFLAYFSWAIISIFVSSFMDWDIEWGSEGIQIQHMCEVSIERPADMDLPSDD